VAVYLSGKQTKLRSHNMENWRIQRGWGSKGRNPTLSSEIFYKKGVEITHFESGTPLCKPKLIVDPLKAKFNSEAPVKNPWIRH
jgi:hypothetical protein